MNYKDLNKIQKDIMGFMDAYERDDMKYYYFAIDSLTDFLIARSLFEDISGKRLSR